MSRRTKEIETLVIAEAELRELLVAALTRVANGRDTGLFVTQHNNPWREVRPSKVGTEIYQLASRIIELSGRLGHGGSALIATKVVNYFDGANDLDNPHRLGPIRLARKLLSEIDEIHG